MFISEVFYFISAFLFFCVFKYLFDSKDLIHKKKLTASNSAVILVILPFFLLSSLWFLN